MLKKNRDFRFVLLVLGFLILSVTNFAQDIVPSPKLVFVGTQDVENMNGDMLTIYWLSVENRAEFPQELFETAPDLPPCGRNTNASRSWVNVLDSGTGYLYGFCGIKSPDELNRLSFTRWKEGKPPKFVYIVIRDRKTNKKYSSNMVEIKK